MVESAIRWKTDKHGGAAIKPFEKVLVFKKRKFSLGETGWKRAMFSANRVGTTPRLIRRPDRLSGNLGLVAAH